MAAEVLAMATPTMPGVEIGGRAPVLPPPWPLVEEVVVDEEGAEVVGLAELAHLLGSWRSGMHLGAVIWGMEVSCSLPKAVEAVDAVTPALLASEVLEPCLPPEAVEPVETASLTPERKVAEENGFLEVSKPTGAVPTYWVPLRAELNASRGYAVGIGIDAPDVRVGVSVDAKSPDIMKGTAIALLVELRVAGVGARFEKAPEGTVVGTVRAVEEAVTNLDTDELVETRVGIARAVDGEVTNPDTDVPENTDVEPVCIRDISSEGAVPGKESEIPSEILSEVGSANACVSEPVVGVGTSGNNVVKGNPGSETLLGVAMDTRVVGLAPVSAKVSPSELVGMRSGKVGRMSVVGRLTKSDKRQEIAEKMGAVGRRGVVGR
jgi:hypothetical protein